MLKKQAVADESIAYITTLFLESLTVALINKLAMERPMGVNLEAMEEQLSILESMSKRLANAGLDMGQAFSVIQALLKLFTKA